MKQLNLTKQRNYNNEPRRYGEEYTSTHSDAYGIDFGDEPSRTKQSEAEACDINNIMKRYEATGLLPDLISREPQYGDFSDAASFQEAMHIVAHAQTQFAALPPEVRARFLNDPARFLKFVEDPKNADELVKMGLATYVEEEAPTAPPPPAKTVKKPGVPKVQPDPEPADE